ncbi:MAG: HmuY family protein [Myxococcota bacterium]
MTACCSGYHIGRTLVLLVAFAAGCSGTSDGPSTGGDDDDDDGGGTSEPTLPAVCEEPAEVACLDEMISDLSFQDTVVDAEVSDTIDGADFVTFVDATAGGFGNETSSPWTYLRFTEDGAQKVEIDDEAAMESMEWHLAARRFILRLNGGSSGPSCVGAAPFLEKSYDELTEIPDDVTFAQDDYYTSDCTLINDSSGLEGSPQVALGAWWEYPGCVATTDVPFLVQLEDGHVIKLRVEQYYTDQQGCNDNNVPSGESANFLIRWTFLR